MPVAFAQTRAGQALTRGDDSCGCCCCCCCKAEEPPEPPPVMIDPLTVTFGGTWEMLVDPAELTPAAIAAGPMIAALRGELRWRARGGQDVRVDIEARSEGPDGAAQGKFPEWTTILGDQPATDVAVFTVDRSMGHTVRLRARASDRAGNVAYANIITVRLGRMRA